MALARKAARSWVLLAILGLAMGLAPSASRAEPLSEGLLSYLDYGLPAGRGVQAAPGDAGGVNLVAYRTSAQDGAGSARQSGASRPIVVAQADKAKDAKAATAPATAAPAAPAAEEKAKMVKPAPDDPEHRYFVGSEPCKVCHAYLFDEFKLTVMGRIFEHTKTRAGGEQMECETCHGPASAHVNGGGGRLGGGIRSFRKSDPRTSVADSNAVCLQCHKNGDRTYWNGSMHENRDVACTDCHTVMRKLSPRFALAKGNVMDTCFQCHKDRRAQQLRTSHMPMIEGKMSCTSCHQPHGSASETAMLREATINDTCYTCHADKRGPFLWEHQPVRENCMNCHEPHGSMHAKLLNVAPQRLCQRCHTIGHGQPGLGTVGQIAQPVPPATTQATANISNLRYQAGGACLNCHQNIHGSNDPSGSRWHR